MNKNDFVSKLQGVINQDDDFKVLIYFAMNTENGVCLKKADIKRDVLSNISRGYQSSIQEEIDLFAQDNERTLLDLSSRDERMNVVYRYDLPNEEPSFFTLMREAYESHDADYFTLSKVFNFDNDKLSDINYFIIEVGTANNKVVIYRNNYNVNLMRQSRGRYYISKSETQFDLVRGDILRIDSQIDALMFDNEVFITNLSYLDNNKEFASIIINRASEALTCIEELNIVDSIEGMQERLTEISFARRVMRALDSSPITEIPKTDIFEFVRNHDVLKNVLKIENNKIKLPSKKSQDSFIRLLNDDFLYSKLSKRDYESKAKNRIRR